MAAIRSLCRLLSPSSLPTALSKRATLLARCLSLHEYISQTLMSEHGVHVPVGYLAESPSAAREAAVKLGGGDVLVKAQVLAGGRGMGHFESGLQGGIQIAHSPEEAESFAEKMIGSRLITKQTGSIGRPCSKVMVCEKQSIKKEFYFALIMDRAHNGPLMVASSEGGMNIEDVARDNPDSIIKDPVDITIGMSKEQAQEMARRIGFSASSVNRAAEQMMNLYTFLLKKDATMLEINPLIETADGRVLCLDAKINYDDNSKFRQKEVFEHKDWSQEDPRDAAAGQAGINYIGLDGSIGCMVNGAGLAMATMDIIKHYGGSPANFLDIGGGASFDEVKKGFNILGSDANVKAIFVNIFGGIVRCDVVADGIIAAAKEMKLNLPVVIRIQGNMQAEANELIKNSGLDMLAVPDFDTAAKTVVGKANESP
ncbi:PREDICTED: succinate--CoA ligase [ADP-forming] subunit beta, mitochondrial-like [Amphimedon queenslandica]|uniref:Succinate--CoA ligase [ADP-forming] subunit beta, mitochondrial n=1 Tax=Amphimedon queenslandica TaxID=400682 RepID=A0A1X7VMF0_AMPQE|nr:PREDICTED: succinate--CoA ligase [ADP-forming] subunit beta, mitochondrial-like [Amphimedon queenslandica]|eukprot:XP_003383654.1 PREDICTED: succinate--CoA ligase [ADP-forming] subunit beta, mitochondrial-like [Amphimedon queenslandica]